MRILLISLLICLNVFGEDCPKALSACDQLVKVQTIQIEHLNEDINLLKEKLEESNQTMPWLLIIGSVVGGFLIGVSLK